MKRLLRSASLSALHLWAAGPARLRRTNVILCFHNFGDGTPEERGYLAARRLLPMDVLKDELEWLARHAEVVPLSDIDSPSDARLRVALTIDDGYFNNVRLLFPLLESMSMPSTWFLSTGFIDEPERLPWWDLLDLLTERWRGVLDLRESGFDFVADLSTPEGRRMVGSTLRAHLKSSSPVTVDDLVSIIRDQASDIEIPPNSFARPEEVAAVVRSGLVDPGGHTMSHPNLKACEPEFALAEIAGGRKRIEEMCGVLPSWFAFPFGGPDAISSAAARLVEEAGFVGSVSTVTGAVDRSSDDRRLLQRVMISPRADAETFRTVVRGARMLATLRRFGDRR